MQTGIETETNRNEIGTKSPEKYVRIAITKNSKGFSYDTTVSLKWDGDSTAYRSILDDLNQEADALARLDIARREAVTEQQDSALIDAALAAAAKDGAR